MEDNREILKNKILELLNIMGIENVEIFERQEEDRVVFNIKTTDAQLLIGKGGANLEALQYLVRILAARLSPENKFLFALDVDDYKDKRVIFLKELARKAAHHVRETKRTVMLTPMTAPERKVVHSYLSLFSDLQSQSLGEEPNRRVVIKSKTMEKPSVDFDFIENS